MGYPVILTHLASKSLIVVRVWPHTHTASDKWVWLVIQLPDWWGNISIYISSIHLNMSLFWVSIGFLTTLQYIHKDMRPVDLQQDTDRSKKKHKSVQQTRGGWWKHLNHITAASHDLRQSLFHYLSMCLIKKDNACIMHCTCVCVCVCVQPIPVSPAEWAGIGRPLLERLLNQISSQLSESVQESEHSCGSLHVVVNSPHVSQRRRVFALIGDFGMSVNYIINWLPTFFECLLHITLVSVSYRQTCCFVTK